MFIPGAYPGFRVQMIAKSLLALQCLGDQGPFFGEVHTGGCQHYGPFLDPHYNAAPSI